MIRKRELYEFSGFSAEERGNWTVIETIDDCINRLLHDDLMMKANNQYTHAERTEMTKTLLFKNLFALACDSRGFEKKLEELKSIFL